MAMSEDVYQCNHIEGAIGNGGRDGESGRRRAKGKKINMRRRWREAEEEEEEAGRR